MTHDAIRHGPTTLLAAVDVLTGRVFGRCTQRHRHAAFTRFLNAVELDVPPDKRIEAVVKTTLPTSIPRLRA